jgi:hypothetical protein
MNWPAATILLCASTFMLAQTGKPGHDWVVVPGIRIGPLTALSGRSDLDKIFDTSQVLDQSINTGDGNLRAGTIVRGGDPSEALGILWTDEQRSRPWQVLLCYGRTEGPCRWHVSNSGIGINTSLDELEKLNGRPFVLLGFERDFAGTVLSWQGGKLERELEGTGRLVLRLNSSGLSKLSPANEAALLSDRIASDHAALRKLRPRVYQILMVFPGP